MIKFEPFDLTSHKPGAVLYELHVHELANGQLASNLESVDIEPELAAIAPWYYWEAVETDTSDRGDPS